MYILDSYQALHSHNDLVNMSPQRNPRCDRSGTTKSRDHHNPSEMCEEGLEA